ncbi:MAG: prepilin peptidase [Clostridia bacterium]|nr:prepilin peptidase [Clostridia bacterium]
MVSYIRPMIPIGHSFDIELFTTLLSMLLFVGMSMLVGATLVKIIRAKGETANMPLTMTITAITALLLFARFGLSVTAIQGVFLMFVLLYASISDIHYHIVDDYIWVIVFALALLNVEKIGMTSMVVGALCVFIPQMAMALLPPHKTLGGADIKLSTALAFLLGGWKGICAYLLGLLVAVIFMCIYNKVTKQTEKKPFALVPFLSVGAMIMFLI